MKPFVPEAEKASEYPQKYHWKVMMLNEAIHAQIKLKADFRRASPEYKKPKPAGMTSTMAEATMMYAWSPGLNH